MEPGAFVNPSRKNLFLAHTTLHEACDHSIGTDGFDVRMLRIDG
jgi:hypothetical protein